MSIIKVSNSDCSKFWGLVNHYKAKLQKCKNRRAQDDAVGDFLESLVALALRRLGNKVRRWKTQGLDIMATNIHRRKDVAIECTNWARTSYYNLTYFNKKVSTLSYYYAKGCGALWIASFKNFPSLKGNPQFRGIHFIELRKQFLPNTITSKDYMRLKRLLKTTLRKI